LCKEAALPGGDVVELWNLHDADYREAGDVPDINPQGRRISTGASGLKIATLWTIAQSDSLIVHETAIFPRARAGVG
jgi:hypothetical protein